jgi:hypothetical protein
MLSVDELRDILYDELFELEDIDQQPPPWMLYVIYDAGFDISDMTDEKSGLIRHEAMEQVLNASKAQVEFYAQARDTNLEWV